MKKNVLIAKDGKFDYKNADWAKDLDKAIASLNAALAKADKAVMGNVAVGIIKTKIVASFDGYGKIG